MSKESKLSIICGVMIAIFNMVIQIIIYYKAPKIFGEMYFSLLLMGINVLLYIFFTLYLRKANGGFWTFKFALKYIFLMALMANLIGLLFTTVFYKFIEPNAYHKIIGIVKHSAKVNYAKFGYNKNQIKEALQGVESQFKSQYNPSFTDFLKTLAVSILVAFVLSLVFSGIFKKENKALIINEGAE